MAVPTDRDPQPVRSLKSFTGDLHALVDWLKAVAVTTVAMESTVVGEPTLAAMIAALPKNTPTRISAARDFGTEEEIEAGPVRRIVELLDHPEGSLIRDHAAYLASRCWDELIFRSL